MKYPIVPLSDSRFMIQRFWSPSLATFQGILESRHDYRCLIDRYPFPGLRFMVFDSLYQFYHLIRTILVYFVK